MNLADRATRVAQGARQVAGALRRQIEAILTPWRVARRLFTDPMTGELTPDALAFFGQLSALGHVDGGTWHADARTHAYREGRREMALTIMRMITLDQQRLAALMAQTREDNDDDGNFA